MKFKCYFILGFLVLTLAANAQEQVSVDEKAVLAVINQLFDGMRAGDSSMVSATFYPGATMFTSFTNKEGQPELKKGDLDRFLMFIGSPHDKVLDEPIWDTEIQIDGNLAQVWTKYAFYLGEEFSHCGVDAFQLTRTNKGWKIFHLTDTRQREGCEVPEAIKNR